MKNDRPIILTLALFLYMFDLAGEDSLKNWYETIGRNGWRLEEFQHYYGNATFDDGRIHTLAADLLKVAKKPNTLKPWSEIFTTHHASGK